MLQVQGSETQLGMSQSGVSPSRPDGGFWRERHDEHRSSDLLFLILAAPHTLTILRPMTAASYTYVPRDRCTGLLRGKYQSSHQACVSSSWKSLGQRKEAFQRPGHLGNQLVGTRELICLLTCV